MWEPLRLVFSLFLAFYPIWSTADQTGEIVRIVRESTGTECSAPCTRAAVVFIHGLMGSKETWLNTSTHAYWPELLASDPDIGSKLDVYRIDYDSFLFSAGPSFVDVERELEEKLYTLITEKKYETVVLVGHSLGGNFARAFLNFVGLRHGHGELAKLRLTYTLGTPMLGSELAHFANHLSGNQHLRVLLPERVNDFEQFLNKNLQNVSSKRLSNNCSRLYMYSAYETKPTAAGIVVPEHSATAFSDLSEGFDLDHVQIAKPVGRDAAVYLWVKSGLDQCLRGVGICQKMENEPPCNAKYK